jgi:hypothetical protein
MAPARRSGRGKVKNIIVRALIAMTAVVGLATPASAAVELDIKRAIIEVVLDNLGVEASAEFITSIAQDLDTATLDSGLVTSVTNLLDTNGDPRNIIESQTDADGDGVPDEGAALSVADDDDDNQSNSGTNSGGGTNSGSTSGNNSGESEEEEAEEEEEPEDEEESEEEESEDEDDD